MDCLVGTCGVCLGCVRKERDKLKKAFREFYVAHGPHLSESWRCFIEDAIGERLFFGLVDRDRPKR